MASKPIKMICCLLLLTIALFPQESAQNETTGQDEAHLLSQITNGLLPSYEDLSAQQKTVQPEKSDTPVRTALPPEVKKKSRPAAVKKNTAPVKYRISHFSITPAVKPVTVSRSRPVQITVQVETQEALRADYYFYMRQITREKILPAVRIFYYPGSRIVNGRSQIQFNFSGSLLYNGKRLPAGAWLLSCDVIFKNENNHTLGKSTMSWGGRSQSVLPEDLIYIK